MPNLLSPTPLAACLLSVALGQPAGAQELGERDHKDLAEPIQEYLDAAGDEEQKIEAKESLREALEKVGKRLVEKGGDPLQGALARTARPGTGAAFGAADEEQEGRGGPRGRRRKPTKAR